MPIQSSNANAVSQRSLHLQVCAPDGSARAHQLPEGQVLIIGSGPACGLRLAGHGMASMHCTLEFNDGAVTIRDWNTESGTYLDGERVDEQTVRRAQFELRVCGYLLQCRLIAAVSEESSKPAHRKAPSSDSARVLERVANTHSNSCQSGEQLRHAASQNETAETTSIGERITDGEPADDEIWDRDFDPWESAEGIDALPGDNACDRVADRLSRQGWHEDTSKLLQAEVEFLRSELAERDERLRMLESLASVDPSEASSEAMVESSEVEKLVGRLEQLLAELDQSDARIAALNEMLRTADDAVQATDQEREQLERWLGEVDHRVSEWEQEWHAERDSLRKQIAELTAERDRAEQQLADGGTDVSSGVARDHLVRQLREEYSRLKSAFLRTEQERDQLRVRLQHASVADAERQVAAAVEAALREERLQLAQEKASMAREKATLTKKYEELQAQLDRKAQSVDSADHRIRAFREHLREIEETEPSRRQGPSLSQRMGKLWRKLEGRPLDTD